VIALQAAFFLWLWQSARGRPPSGVLFRAAVTYFWFAGCRGFRFCLPTGCRSPSTSEGTVSRRR
jgi:hypothetical protein